MQRLSLGVLAPLALLLATSQAAVAADLTITTPWASVRARPEPQAPAVALVFGNDALPVVRQADGWVQVRLPGGRMGWIDRTHGVLNAVVAAARAAALPLASVPVPGLAPAAPLSAPPAAEWPEAPGGT